MIVLISSFCESYHAYIRIPEYQRPYKWTAHNANQLLDDIEDGMNDNKEVYRVGTLILHHDKDNCYNIVDGQQRTITFSLLLKCLTNNAIPFLNQKLSNNPYNAHNVINNYRALQRRMIVATRKVLCTSTPQQTG